MSYSPPINFSLVESGVYRSGYPTPRNFVFLRDKLKLKTVLSLSPPEPDNALRTQFEEKMKAFLEGTSFAHTRFVIFVVV